ncbi:50S ribosomal protein L10 [Rubrobacter marinus]|uniref:Large ribosomal subunit protein uL10 n=1 Tax=Rubrobacter marinus TaxID=2653852 RepID=A0A6G8PV40_9ACTN|nr:50S ribosomal protein L10 [Rubrobacter marinus]QIN78071.1 50S ribosomal protein L10 [Rubrobacter marinus]
MKREDKARVIEELTEKLRGSSVVLVDFKGMNVAQSTRLRARSREAGVDFVVAKNTLAQRAANEAGVEGLDEFLVGPTALAFSDDPVASAKLMAEFADDIEAFELKGGLLDGGRVMGSDDVVALSKLPGREQLLAQLLGAIQAPVAGLVTVLNAPLRNLAVVLNGVAEQKQQ